MRSCDERSPFVLGVGGRVAVDEVRKVLACGLEVVKALEREERHFASLQAKLVLACLRVAACRGTLGHRREEGGVRSLGHTAKSSASHRTREKCARQGNVGVVVPECLREMIWAPVLLLDGVAEDGVFLAMEWTCLGLSRNCWLDDAEKCTCNAVVNVSNCGQDVGCCTGYVDGLAANSYAEVLDQWLDVKKDNEKTSNL